MVFVVVCGPQQCGSTRLYNEVRLLLEHDAGGPEKVQVTSHPDRIDHDASKHVLTKKHQVPKTPLYDRAILLLPHRDIRDSAISRTIRLHGDQPASAVREAWLVKAANEQLRLFAGHRARADLLCRYETHGIAQLRGIVKLLGLIGITDSVLRRVMAEVEAMPGTAGIPDKNDLSEWYKRTSLTSRHCTNNGAVGRHVKYLTDAERAAITSLPLYRLHGEWLEKRLLKDTPAPPRTQ